MTQTARGDAAFLDACRAAVGPAFVITDAADMQPYLTDWRGRFTGAALAIVRPDSTAQVAQIVLICREYGVPLVPQGGNTGLVGGQIPDRSGKAIILNLSRMKAIREIDNVSNVMVVEAGLTLAEAHAAAERAGRLFPLTLASQGSCSVGGNMATNAGGTGVIAYGNMRELVLGVEVVLADGRVMNGLSKLKKDNTGYDLKHLFMGSEGTLGVITAAVLKLFPKPKAIEIAFIGLESPAKALKLLDLAREEAGGQITAFELIPRTGLSFVLKHASGAREPLRHPHDWYVLLELSSQNDQGLGQVLEGLVHAAVTTDIVQDAVIAQNNAQRAAFWQLREMMSEVQGKEGGSIKNDVSVPVSKIPEFLEKVSAAVFLAMPGARMVPFGHMGDGNIHCNISQPVAMDKQVFLSRWNELTDIVNEIVVSFGGSISAEHGIGQLKVGLLRRYKDPVALEVMRTIKAALDPKGLMNPGKVL